MAFYSLYLMATLFPDEKRFPPGFQYYEEFIDAAEEKELLDSLSGLELNNLQFQGFEAKRKVASFGYDWSFDTRVLSKGRQIPDEFNWLIEKVAVRLGIAKNTFAEVLVTEYPIGSVINWHRDAPPFDLIAGVSLLSDCTFRLKPHEKAKQDRNSIISFLVKRRSLYVMSGESRTNWQHSIAPVNAVRYSITLRTLKNQGAFHQ